MRVYELGLGEKTKASDIRSDAIAISVDGIHAHLIIQQTRVGLQVHEPSDDGYAELALSYGLRPPHVTNIANP